MNAPASPQPATFELPAWPVDTSVGSYFISNYPPFSCWSNAQIPELERALENAPAPGPISLYVHLPFCRHRCHYCYFRVYPRSTPEEVDQYINAVLKECQLYGSYPALLGRRPRTVYFGGGSPSFLSLNQLTWLLGSLRDMTDWSDVVEATFECEPGSANEQKLALLRTQGISRLSLGFQSLDNEVLRRAGRDVRVEDCLRSYQQARQAGFREINIDLLAGLPEETEKSWRRTVDDVIELLPDCITVYQLELSYNSALHASRVAGRRVDLPDWPTKQQWVAQAFREFEAAGYTIGSGYMAVRNPSQWRFVYTVDLFWHGADLLALGETAFGHIQGVHYQNADTFASYTNLLAAQRLPVRRALRLRPKEKLHREVILQLKTGSLDPAYFQKKFGVDLATYYNPQWTLLEQHHLAERTPEAIRLTREGLLQVDRLLPLFYLPEHQGVRYT